ncbi:hypothetical protein BSL78_28784 [Apostichopus japonicus]|uniref:3'-5' exonuclease domain-containing protein n=1 Tax=Stichopus japonicus TaxID=307972 RepID=A0A2G8JF85_STIJA|nr:hypothetical protein BSL78_28784 [Apostichopus japonicus]
MECIDTDVSFLWMTMVNVLNGILNTTRLEESLKGVSDFTSFIGKNKPVIVTAVPLTTERSTELKWSTGTWEVIAIRPRFRRPDMYQLPGPYRSRSQWKIPTVSKLFRRPAGYRRVHQLRSVQHDFKRFITEQGRSVPRGKNLIGEPVLIETVDECRQQVRKLLEKARKGSDPEQLVVALDCEGDNLGKEGPLTLLQIATVEGEVFVFDVLATPQPEDMFIDGELKILLEEKKILKVVHDCRTDQCALYFQFGVTLTNVFDTSVAYTTIWEQCNIFAGPYRPKLSLLIELYGLTAKHKTDEFEALVHDKQLFAKRPLTKEMIQYAADDVRCLVPVIYGALNKLISPLWRPSLRRA